MMIPNPTRLTKIVRKMMRRGRVTSLNILYNQPLMRRMTPWRAAERGLRTVAFLLVAAATVGGQQRAQEPTRVANLHADTMRPEILGTHGIVAAGRHYSVSAGVRILQQGGNAIDAGVATVLAASVV